MADPTIIIGIAKTADGYIVMDQLQREHHAPDAKTLGAVIAQLCTDDEIPVAERVQPNAQKIRNAAVKVTRKLLPEYGDAAEPIVDGLTGFAKFVHAKIVERANAPKEPQRRGPRPARTPPKPKISVRQEGR